MDDALRRPNRASTLVLAAVVRRFAGSRLERDVLSRVYELVRPQRSLVGITVPRSAVSTPCGGPGGRPITPTNQEYDA